MDFVSALKQINYNCIVIRETRTSSKPKKIQTKRQWAT